MWRRMTQQQRASVICLQDVHWEIEEALFGVFFLTVIPDFNKKTSCYDTLNKGCGSRAKMSGLFSDYEKQFGILSADITAKIAKVPNLSGGKKNLFIARNKRRFLLIYFDL